MRFMLAGDNTDGGFSLVGTSHSAASPRRAPLHRHSREDEYSFVLEGRLAALLGDEVVNGEVGDLIIKPRDQWHTLRNAGDEPARIFEIISPAGFERYLRVDDRPFERSAGLVIPASSTPSRRSMDLEVNRAAFRASPRHTASAGAADGLGAEATEGEFVKFRETRTMF
jgi:quercetin dioxygenase-like cupin family protein